MMNCNETCTRHDACTPYPCTMRDFRLCTMIANETCTRSHEGAAPSNKICNLWLGPHVPPLAPLLLLSLVLCRGRGCCIA
jgi:hypothetical protein